MMRRLALVASMVLILCFTSSATSFNVVTDVAAQASASQASPPREQPQANMQDMMKMHEQMMAEMKAADGRLDSLVKEMNAASGEAKVNAVAVVVTELVGQQKAMHEHMRQMHQQMMGGRGMMMKK
jgi:vancomycin resistance protein YoaR